MLKKFITSHPIHKKIVIPLDWIMLLRLELMLYAWMMVCIGMYISSLLNGSIIINVTEYSLRTFLFFSGITLFCSSIFILQQISNLNHINEHFNYQTLLTKDKALRVSNIIVVIGSIMIIIVDFTSILPIAVIYFFYRISIPNSQFFSLTKEKSTLVLSILFGVLLIGSGFIYNRSNLNLMSLDVLLMAALYFTPFVLGYCSVAILTNKQRSDDSKGDDIIALILCLIALFVGLMLNEPLSSVASISVIPFYIFLVARGKEKDTVRAIRYPILILNFYVLTIYPLLFFPLVIIYYLSKYYNWHRLSIHYPTLLVDND